MSYPESCQLPPRPEQVIGTQTLLGKRPIRGCFGLWDEVGVGKSKQVIDALCQAYVNGWTGALIAVTPGYARSVWHSSDPLLGEVAKHAWDGLRIEQYEYCARTAYAMTPKELSGSSLLVVTTNYEFLRRPERLAPLMAFAKANRTWLVGDESWMVKTHNAQQTKAFKSLRQACQMVVLLNGTPGKPEETYAQFDIMSPDILGVRNFWAFKARYCVLGGYQGKQIVGYQRMDEFAAKTAPYILQRSADTLGLDKPIELVIEARLTLNTWKHYTALRDEFLTYLEGVPGFVQAPQAGVRAMRMSQVLAGFVGGLERVPEGEDGGDVLLALGETQIGREKRQTIIDFLLANDVQASVIWCKFRAEMAGLTADLSTIRHVVHMLHGQQPPDEREATKRAFAPGLTPPVADEASPTHLVGHPAAGGAGLNLARANFVLFPTPATLRHRQQGIGRVQRPGQTRTVRIVDVVAVGPDGQETLDHHQLRAVRANEDITKWTAANWKQALAA